MARKKIRLIDRQIDCSAVPAVQGLRIPAEWETHESTWMAWPHRRSDWPGKFQPIPWVFGEIIRWLHLHEPVNILVNNQRSESQAKLVLGRAGVELSRLRFWHCPTNRVWIRDYGAMFLVGRDGQKAFIDWGFNAWAKYPDWKKDDAIPGKIGESLKYPSWRPSRNGRRIVLEGGSIDVNGRGLLLTTEECLRSDVQSRNPGLPVESLEQILADYLNINKVLWLNRGIAGDDTHGHVDDIARFVGVRTIVAAVESNPDDDNYVPLQENLCRLNQMTGLDDRKLEIVPLPMPAPLHCDNQRLPASYANFYIANGLVLVPTFNDPNDRIALGTLSDLFPGRKVVGIHSVDLVWGLGTLHCMTHQEPAAFLSDDGAISNG
jgi:agmatine deiminase